MKNIKEQIYDSILEDLIDGVYPIDFVFNEKFLIDKYQVSRSPIRDALVYLRPVYAAEEGSSRFTLKKVVVASGVRVGFGDTVQLAMADLLDADPDGAVDRSPTDESTDEGTDDGSDEGTTTTVPAGDRSPTELLAEAGLPAPKHGTAYSTDEALAVAREIGYPVLVRPSYVLGGRGMEIVYDDDTLVTYVERATEASPDHPILVDRFLDDAVEIDVDVLYDGVDMYLGGVMEHIEQAGVHSGDSACSLPPYYLTAATITEIKRQTAAMAKALNVVGLMNVQFAIQQIDGKDVIYVLEVNPRASRTVPFVSKATGVQLAKVAARCMAGQSLDVQGIGAEVTPPYFSVKEAVFPFVKFPGVDTILGPEMKSTGEVMGVGKTFGEAFVKAQLGAGTKLPRATDAVNKVFITVKNNDKARAVDIARALVAMNFVVVATKGTAAAISAAGVPCTLVNKVTEGRPHIVDMIKNNEIAMVINTVEERRNAIADSRAIRTSSLLARVTTFTTIFGAEAAVEGMKYMDNLGVISVQEMHAQLA